MMAHPILINRPIVVSPKGVKLCRPSEAVLDLLPAQRDLELPDRDLEPLVPARVPIQDEVLERARGAGARLRPTVARSRSA